MPNNSILPPKETLLGSFSMAPVTKENSDTSIHTAPPIPNKQKRNMAIEIMEWF